MTVNICMAIKKIVAETRVVVDFSNFLIEVDLNNPAISKELNKIARKQMEEWDVLVTKLDSNPYDSS